MKSWKTYVCKHFWDKGAPILSVRHAGDSLDALCAELDHDDPDLLVVVHWGHLRDRDPSLVAIERHLHPGIVLSREAPGASWVVASDAA